jgi:hypothetical protein
MRTDDAILVSIDDHVIEPPHMFEQHIPQRYRDRAPVPAHPKAGTTVGALRSRATDVDTSVTSKAGYRRRYESALVD